jgi:phage baseplate assembly protein gpV
MALQKINWLQIDTANVPSGSVVDLGSISKPLHAVYAENLFVSGVELSEFIGGIGVEELNLYTASLKDGIELTGSNVTIKGNLLVKGTTTSVNSNVVTIGDNVIELNGTEGLYGGLLIKDPTTPNQISGSLLWDTANDRWIAGPLGFEEPIILQSNLDNLSGSLTDRIDSISETVNASNIWNETGSFYATTNDLQVTGSMTIKGDLRVEGTTTLIKNDSALNSLIVSGAMSVVKNQFASASISIENLGVLSDRMKNSVIDCGDGFF